MRNVWLAYDGAAIPASQESPDGSVPALPGAAQLATSTAPASGKGQVSAHSAEPTVTAPAGAPPATLVRTDLIVGGGAVAKDGDTLSIHYVAALYSNGHVFDSSWNPDHLFSLQLGVGEVIKGWDEGLLGMRVGGRRELVIPPALAYGQSGVGGGQSRIPPNATLIFIIDLLSVTNTPSGPTAPATPSTATSPSNTTTTTTTPATTTTTPSAPSSCGLVSVKAGDVSCAAALAAANAAIASGEGGPNTTVSEQGFACYVYPYEVDCSSATASFSVAYGSTGQQTG
jgi:peptidylprolyl isomerase